MDRHELNALARLYGTKRKYFGLESDWNLKLRILKNESTLDDYWNGLTVEAAKGKILTKIARLYGIKRRLWGLEPDFMLRKRIVKLAVGIGAKSWEDFYK